MLDKDLLDTIEVGDRIRFRAATRSSDKEVWRKVNGFGTNGQPTVRFHGWGDFVVRWHEISMIEWTPKLS